MSFVRFTTKSVGATQKIAATQARLLIRHLGSTRNEAIVIALEGELGTGKTTFAQGFTRAFGVAERVLSPTFVILKIYPLDLKRSTPRHLVHIDCYRLDSPKDILHLGLGTLLKDRDAVVLIEWADRIKKLIPKNAIWIKFKHGKSPRERIIEIRRN